MLNLVIAMPLIAKINLIQEVKILFWSING